MRYLRFLLFALCAITVQAGRKFEPQVRPIVSRSRQFPYHVIIRPSNSETDRFSGALISRQYVLTAAAPLAKLKGDLHISYGAYLLEHGNRRFPEPARIDIVVPQGSDIIMHEEFRREYPTVDNIALIKLPNPVNFSDAVQPIKLPTVEDEFRDWVGTHVSIIGLGARYRGTRLSKATNYYNTSIISNNECKKQYSTWERNLCTDASLKGSYCAGTMGSPITTLEDEPTLVAIAMEPEGCAQGTAIVHTQVAPYLYWVKMHSDYEPPEAESDEEYEDLNVKSAEKSSTVASSVAETKEVLSEEKEPELDEY